MFILYKDSIMHLFEIKLKIGLIPCSSNSPSLQGLKLISSVSEYLYHAEWASPFKGQLVLHLIGVTFSHYQVDNLELSGSPLGLLIVLYPSLQGFGLDARLLSHLLQQV